MLGTTYIDESEDEVTHKVFVASGFIVHGTESNDFRREWKKCLKRTGLKDYFKNSECMAVDGRFDFLRHKYRDIEAARQAALKIRSQFDAIIQESNMTVMAAAMPIRLFKEFDSKPEVQRNPHWVRNYMVATIQVAIGMVLDEMRMLTEQHNPEYPPIMSFICDKSSLSKYVSEAYDALPIKYPTFKPYMGELLNLDDTRQPLLQAADLMAAICREMCMAGMDDEGRLLKPRVAGSIYKIKACTREALEEALKGNPPWVSKDEIKKRRQDRRRTV